MPSMTGTRTGRRALSTRDVRRLARRGGVQQIWDVRTVRQLAGDAMRAYMTNLIRDALRYSDMAHPGSPTIITAADIMYARTLRDGATAGLGRERT